MALWFNNKSIVEGTKDLLFHSCHICLSFQRRKRVLVLGQCALLLLFSFPLLVFKVTEPENKGAGSVKKGMVMEESQGFHHKESKTESALKIAMESDPKDLL